MENESEHWTNGWVFYKSNGIGEVPPGESSIALQSWMKGFGSAMADDDLGDQHPSIQAALLHYGIDADLLEDCLQAAETLLEEVAFNRWPTVPVRGFGNGNLKMGPFVVVLPEAANDETMPDSNCR